MPLFDIDSPDADLAYRNIRTWQSPTEATIKEALEALWHQYEPYSDSNFASNFARQPDIRFWEMYLTVELLNQGKNVRPRSDLPAAGRDVGPDIRIIEENRSIWIEAVAPGRGDLENADQVPAVVPINEGGRAQFAPRRQVELRITSALWQKRNAFEGYREQRLIAPNDLCLIAISGGRIFTQSSTLGLPPAVSAVYPFGEQYATFDRQTGEIVESGYHRSQHIERTGAEPVPRSAFLTNEFSGIHGLIWSRRTIGNFTNGDHDFVFVNNVTAQAPFPTSWMAWAEEAMVRPVGDQFELTRIPANR